MAVGNKWLFLASVPVLAGAALWLSQGRQGESIVHTLDEDYRTFADALAGTREREEVEFKLAFPASNLTLKQVSGSIAQALDHRTRQVPFELEKLINNPFKALESFETFGFRDVYLDTPDFALFQQRSAYRLRHRWSRFGLYVRHKIFPYLTAYHPIRSEIQFKTGYTNQGDHLMLAKESRFEFRAESDPFSRGEDVPPAPWPEEEYLGYAQSGYFRHHKILPTFKAAQVVGDAGGEVQFSPVFKIITARRRSHINLRNPWGRAPNPDQLFIITIDRSTVEHIYPRFTDRLNIPQDQNETMMEIEVELDRSTFTSIRQLAESEVHAEMGSLAKYGVTFSQQALAAYRQDLATLRGMIEDALRQDFGVAFAESDYKYSRILRQLRGSTMTEAH